MCVQKTWVLYSDVITRQSIIHLFHSSTVCVMNSRVSGQWLYTISPLTVQKGYTSHTTK